MIENNNNDYCQIKKDQRVLNQDQNTNKVLTRLKMA